MDQGAGQTSLGVCPQGASGPSRADRLQAGSFCHAAKWPQWVKSGRQAVGGAATWIGLHIAIVDAILRPSAVAESNAASLSNPVRLIRSNVFVAIRRIRSS